MPPRTKRIRYSALILSAVTAIVGAFLLFSRPVSPTALGLSGEGVPQPSVDSGSKAATDDGDEPSLADNGVDTLPVEDGYVLVANYSDLKSALEDASVTHVRLVEDIVLQQGITVHPARDELVIDGGQALDGQLRRHTLTEPNGVASQTQAMYLQSNIGLKNVIIRNLEVEGANFYGFFTVSDSAQNVTITYENVVYRGPQMTYNRRGTARYVDCDIYLGRFGRTGNLGEVGELAAAEFSGRVNITQVDTDNVNEVFFFELDNPKRWVKVDAGAVVDISYYNAGFVFVNSLRGVDFTVGDNAVFRFRSSTRFWEGDRCFDTVDIADGAQVSIEVDQLLDRAMFRAATAFRVGEGATLHMVHRGNSAHPLLTFEGTATFDNPKSVLLYNPSFRTIRYLSSGTLTIQAQQLNNWTAAGPGGFDDRPANRWRQTEGSGVISGTVAVGDAGELQFAQSTFEPDNATTTSPPNQDNFSLQKSRVISFGELALTAHYGNSVIYGKTDVWTDILAAYPQSGVTQTATASSGADGEYVVAVPEPLVLEEIVIVEAHKDYLYQKATFAVGLQALQIMHLPDSVVFETTPLSSSVWTARRSDPDWTITVQDTRASKTPWSLRAMLLEPLTARTEEGDLVLPNVISFVDDTGRSVPLSMQDEVLIYRHTPQAPVEEVAIEWERDRGLLAHIPPGMAAAHEEYRAKILWILEDAE